MTFNRLPFGEEKLEPSRLPDTGIKPPKFTLEIHEQRMRAILERQPFLNQPESPTPMPNESPFDDLAAKIKKMARDRRGIQRQPLPSEEIDRAAPEKIPFRPSGTVAGPTKMPAPKSWDEVRRPKRLGGE